VYSRVGRGPRELGRGVPRIREPFSALSIIFQLFSLTCARGITGVCMCVCVYVCMCVRVRVLADAYTPAVLRHLLA
jgi:hypothetical protein